MAGTKKSKKSKHSKKPLGPEELAGRVFTVCVTRKDILKGIPQSVGFCPIALALKRATGVKDIEVEGNTIRVDGLPNIDTPREIDEFVGDFDDKEREDEEGRSLPALKRVRPFKFRLRLPVPEVEAIDGDIEIL